MINNFIKQIFLPIVIIGLCIILLYSAYKEVRLEAVNQLNVEQLTYAKQAATGIQLFFNNYDILLSYLANQNAIIDANETGKNLAALFYNSHAPEIQAITRIDENGKILFTVPNNQQFAGKDISYQEHIKRILNTHRPVLSDIFETVQGFRSVAYYVPVFRNGVFKGGIAILIPFENLAKNYLRNIKVRQTDFAWTVSQNGIVIYSPFKEHNNQNAFALFSNHPELISVLKKAASGEYGFGFYSWTNPKLPKSEPENFCAVYYPIKIADRFWSIIVATPEAEALSTMKGFIEKWVILIILLLLGTSVYLYYVNKARAILKEETKRKKAEEALRQSEQKFKTLFHTAGDSIFLLELDGKFIEANDYALNKLGYSREEFLQLSVLDLNFPLDPEKISSRLELVRKKGELSFESIFQTKKGELINVDVNVRVIDYEEHKVLLSIARDISIKKKEEEELIRAKDEAEIASRLKSEFLAQMSHEIRSPLNVVMGFTELLKDNFSGQLTDDMENSFKGIGIAGKRIIRTVELILNMSELQAGVYESMRKHFDLSKDVLESILHEYEISAKKRGLGLSLKKNTEDTMVYSDFFSTSQIFVNLIDNAIKYTPEGKVEVTISRNGNNELTVVVADTGIGISKDFLPKLFEPFTQEQQGYSRKYEGTGLGMALVKRYCEINNVEILVDTDKNRGTNFTLSFKNQNNGITN